MSLVVKLADLHIGLESDTPELKDFLKDYIVEQATPDFIITWTEEDIAQETQNAESEFSRHYIETLVVLRKISELLPKHQRFLFHGASISYDDKAYLFTAPSGTGKSTHIRLWRKLLGNDVNIVNGDKPFISLQNNEPYIYGTPWAGKERWQRNCSFPLGGICFIQRGLKNNIRSITPEEALPLILKQVYLPQDPQSLDCTLQLLDTLMNGTPLYLLSCDISEEAVRCSFEALTGLSYIDQVSH